MRKATTESISGFADQSSDHFSYVSGSSYRYGWGYDWSRIARWWWCWNVRDVSYRKLRSDPDTECTASYSFLFRAMKNSGQENGYSMNK